MENLYHKQFKRNMEFALKNIGYQAAFDFYAEVLAYYSFGTWGFWGVFDPWIAATQDLESALNILSASQALFLKEEDINTNEQKARKYDLTEVLKKMLANFILWTPLEREQLDVFYTNKEALETGREDLWGIMRNMTGNRVNICPIYATEQELFEAFMFHDPKNGATFKKIIDDWQKENEGAYQNFKQKIANARETALKRIEGMKNEENEAQILANLSEVRDFVHQYSPAEQYFVEDALESNPNYIHIDSAISDLQNMLKEMSEDPNNSEAVTYFRSQTKSSKIKHLKIRLKELHFCVHVDFEKWLEEEEDANVLFYIQFLIQLKIYDKGQDYARYQLLKDRKYWQVWRK